MTLSRARSLPAQDIRAVGRVDSSGTTSLFTSYLSFASEWTQGNRTLVAFPACVTRVKGSDGMASAVRAAPYSLGRAPRAPPAQTAAPSVHRVPGRPGARAAPPRSGACAQGHAPGSTGAAARGDLVTAPGPLAAAVDAVPSRQQPLRRRAPGMLAGLRSRAGRQARAGAETPMRAQARGAGPGGQAGPVCRFRVGYAALTAGAPGRYVELGWAKSAGLALVAVANVAGNFRQPDPARFGTGVPAGVSGLSVAGDGWAGIAVGASSAPAPRPAPPRPPPAGAGAGARAWCPAPAGAALRRRARAPRGRSAAAPRPTPCARAVDAADCPGSVRLPTSGRCRGRPCSAGRRAPVARAAQTIPTRTPSSAWSTSSWTRTCP